MCVEGGGLGGGLGVGVRKVAIGVWYSRDLADKGSPDSGSATFRGESNCSFGIRGYYSTISLLNRIFCSEYLSTIVLISSYNYIYCFVSSLTI